MAPTMLGYVSKNVEKRVWLLNIVLQKIHFGMLSCKRSDGVEVLIVELMQIFDFPSCLKSASSQSITQHGPQA
jgi:hypothetical protein